MADGFNLSFEFADRWVRFAKPEYLRIYLYILARYEKDGTVLSNAEIAELLDTTKNKVHLALEYWQMEGFLTLSKDGGYTVLKTKQLNNFSEKDNAVSDNECHKEDSEKAKKHISERLSRPSYTHTEIDRAAEKNKKLSYLFSEAEKILGRLLSTNDIEVLYSFTDWLSLPVEVIIMIISYAASVGKVSMRYIERVALDWSDREIDTYEKAETYIKELEQNDKKTRKIRTMLGIQDHAPSATEKKYINSWIEKDISLDLIPLAYDKTIVKSGKLSWAYMNKILLSWQEQGIKTENDVEKADAAFYESQGSKSGSKQIIRQQPATKNPKSITNYTDTNEIDYKKYAEQVLADMLDE